MAVAQAPLPVIPSSCTVECRMFVFQEAAPRFPARNCSILTPFISTVQVISIFAELLFDQVTDLILCVHLGIMEAECT